MMAELWWVSVGGNSAEPAQVVPKNQDTWEVFTIGCNDGTLIHKTQGDTIELLQIITAKPLTTSEAEAKSIAWEKQQEEDERNGIHHHYRRFD